MKLTVKTDRNTLFLSSDGSYQEHALHTFPLSACHFGLEQDHTSGHTLTYRGLNGESARLFRFENEYQAIEALTGIRKKLRQQRGLNSVRSLATFVFWPVAALAFIVSVNGAIMNMNRTAQQLPADMYIPVPGQQAAPQQQAPASPQPQVQKQPEAPKNLAANDILALKDAVTDGRFTISLSAGHKHTLYVFSDPMCPHCRDLEPRLQELSKRYNVEVFPVSAFGGLRSVVRTSMVLDTAKKDRVKRWQDVISMGMTTMDPKFDDPKAVPDTTGARLSEANDMAYNKFGFIGTPSIVADTGDVLPVAVVVDDAQLQQTLGE